MEHKLKEVIKGCDLLIKAERFDELMGYYTENTILAIKPVKMARGKEEIKRAFIKIAQHCNHTIVPKKSRCNWLCIIDNSYGTSLIGSEEKV
jgi:ketosteroid isomerase-like protein